MALYKCAYCGCTDSECLAGSPESPDLFFCNGKGVIPQSHIVHFLKNTNRSTISLPPTNQFSKMQFKCYICNSTNIFQLGFVKFQKDPKIYIACRQPCQHDEQIQLEPTHTFIPIVQNGQINESIVKIPEPDKYKKVTVAETVAVLGQAKAQSEQTFSDSSLHLSPSKFTYNSPADFCGIMKAFVNAERGMTHELEKARRYGDMEFDWKDKTTVYFTARTALYKLLSLGAKLKFTKGEVNEFARVKEISKTRVIKCVFQEDSSFYNQKKGITISIIHGDVTFERQLAGLETFKTDKNCMHYIIREVILGNIKHLKDHNRVKGQTIEVVQPPTNQGFPKLNDIQVKVIKTALKQRFTMIQGPPGTGKTTVIAATVASFLSNNISPILVLTQTNIAADFATKRISQTGNGVVRVLSYSKESSGYESELDDSTGSFEIMQYTSSYKALQKNGTIFSVYNSSQDPNEKRQARDMEREIIQASKVVCTTCGTCGGARLQGLKFKVVIFDECGQCLDPDIVIGAIHGAQQLIIVGDHRQLGPIVLSRAAKRSGYDVSLMQRITGLGIRPSFLKMQYRMHPSISQFPSEVFYNKLIIDAVSAAERTWERPVLPWPNPEHPTFFWNIEGKEENYDSATSIINTNEVQAIASLIDMMARNGIRKGSDIGIITPYTGQQMYLMDSLDTFCQYADTELINNIEIASVDSFQGREKNFIIFSCVRANDMNDVGFLKDLRRLCVSLTRAKYGLIIVGNANTFARNSCWCKLIQHLMSKGVFVEGELESLHPSTFTALADESQAEEDLVEDDEEYVI